LNYAEYDILDSGLRRDIMRERTVFDIDDGQEKQCKLSLQDVDNLRGANYTYNYLF
jgi:hypothetical protein